MMKQLLKLATLAVLCGATLSSRQLYVLNAPAWGDSEKAAVANAGGSLTFVHTATGIAFAKSGNPNFSQELLATGLFSAAAADMMVQWQPPLKTGDFVEAAVTPGNETFWNA
jgi:hypothetical protein